MLWEKVGIDIVYMPWDDEIGFIVFARDDLSGWVEARAIDRANSKNVAKFIYEDVICRHGCPLRIVLDGGRENLDLTKDLLERYRIQRTVVSAYHPQANGLVERGHDSIVNSLAKYCKGGKRSDWVKYLPLAFWADWISVHQSTGYSAFELLYERECLLLVEISIQSWCIVDWEGEVRTREDLLLARMRQLDSQTTDHQQAAENLRNSRKNNKAYFDQNKPMRSDLQQLRLGDLVLIYISKNQLSRARKIKIHDRWIGPYRIREIPADSTYYFLEELDGVELKESFAGNRLRKFFTRRDLDQDRGEQHAVIQVRDALDVEPEEAANDIMEKIVVE